MDNYRVEIKSLGKYTLDKFLLLLLEDVKLRTEKSKNIKEHFSSHRDLLIEYNSLRDGNKNTSKGKKDKDIFVAEDSYFELKRFDEKRRKLSESQYLASNAYFIYLFAIFDQFLLAVTEIVLKNDPKIMINFKNYCLSHYEQTKDKMLFKVLPFEEKLIEFLPNLPSPISISSKILNIDFKDDEFISHYFNLVEMRERRNLLVHRSGYGDNTYLKSIKNHIATFPQKKRNKFMKGIEKNIQKNLRIEPDYFITSIETLYFFVCIIANYSLDNNSEVENTKELFTEPFHDLLINTLENPDAKSLLRIPEEILDIYQKKDLNGNLNIMGDVSKVNWILLNEAKKEYTSELIEEFRDSADMNSEEDLNILKSYEKIITKIREETRNKNKQILEHIKDIDNRGIISAFLERNYYNYLSCLEKIIYKVDIGVELESWYMHKKLSEDIKFRELYSDFRKKNNLDIKKINLNKLRK